MNFISNYHHALIIRFFKFFSANILSIIVPLAIFNLTHNISVAGIAILLEWTPKIILYLVIGQIVHIKGEVFLKKSSYLLKTLSIFFGCLVLAGYLPWYFLLSIGPFSQANAAVFNVLYEVNAKKWSGCDSSGHANFLKIDNISGVFALSICFLLRDTFYLMILAFIISVINLWWIIQTSDLLYETNKNISHKFSFCEIKNQFNLLTKPLLYNTLLDFSINFPLAVLFGAYPFFLAYALNVHELKTEDYSLINLARTASCALALHVCGYYIKKYNSWSVFKISFAFTFISLSLLLILKQNYFIISSICFGALSFCCYPWIRSHRQKYAKLNSGSHSVTSLITALKSLAYLFSGFLLSLHFEPLKTLLFCTIFLLFIGTFSLYKIIEFDKKQ